MNFKDMSPTKKRNIIIAGVVILIILVVIFLMWRRKNKKKKEQSQMRFQNQAQQNPVQEEVVPSTPRMQIVPEEDKEIINKPEPAMSVEQAIPVEKPKERPPVSNGNMGAAHGNPNVNKQPIKPQSTEFKSALGPEFMMNANDPNATV
jgi:FtsZ-interacting cell division protein ZipA